MTPWGARESGARRTGGFWGVQAQDLVNHLPCAGTASTCPANEACTCLTSPEAQTPHHHQHGGPAARSLEMTLN
jgi:hypothetical protein